MVSINSIALSIGTVLLSIVGSYIVARKIAGERIEAEENRKLQRWYRDANILAQRSIDDWIDYANSGKEITIPKEVFANRRDELWEHSATGRTIAVDGEIVEGMEVVATWFSAALEDEVDRSFVEDRLIGSAVELQQQCQDRIEDDTPNLSIGPLEPVQEEQ